MAQAREASSRSGFPKHKSEMIGQPYQIRISHGLAAWLGDEGAQQVAEIAKDRLFQIMPDEIRGYIRYEMTIHSSE
jgi:hypothetical protein